MRTSHFIPHDPDIARPKCDKCGTHMWLTRIDPDKPDFDKRTFECPLCEAVTIKIVKFK